MLPGPTNVPNRVMRAMLAPIINHRSDDFVEFHGKVSPFGHDEHAINMINHTHGITFMMELK